MTPVGCAVGPPITGQLTLEGIPVMGLVDTGTSVTCLGFSVWWRYHAQWGPLRQFEGTVHGTHGNPLQIAGKMPPRAGKSRQEKTAYPPGDHLSAPKIPAKNENAVARR